MMFNKRLSMRVLKLIGKILSEMLEVTKNSLDRCLKLHGMTDGLSLDLVFMHPRNHERYRINFGSWGG